MSRNTLISLVDDHILIRGGLASLINSFDGYTVLFEADHGQHFIDQLSQHGEPSIVLLDITMPKLNGLKALRAIKAYDPAATVIICTATGQKSLIMEALHCGAKDFIIKPYFDRLIPALKNVE